MDQLSTTAIHSIVFLKCNKMLRGSANFKNLLRKTLYHGVLFSGKPGVTWKLCSSESYLKSVQFIILLLHGATKSRQHPITSFSKIKLSVIKLPSSYAISTQQLLQNTSGAVKFKEGEAVNKRTCKHKNFNFLNVYTTTCIYYYWFCGCFEVRFSPGSSFYENTLINN